MCGIVGLISTGADLWGMRAPFERLLRDAESRGREASGVVWMTPQTVTILKAPAPATRLMRQPVYRHHWEAATKSPALQAVMGHSRLTTHGSELHNENNQPVHAHGYTLIHNGIVTNFESLWKALGARPGTALDTEVLPALLHRDAHDDTLQVESALAKLADSVRGTVSIAFVHAASAMAWLYTNHGSLHWTRVPGAQAIAFASESRFLHSALNVELQDCTQVRAGEMLQIHLERGDIDQKTPTTDGAPAPTLTPRRLEVLASGMAAPASERPATFDVHVKQGWSEFEVNWDRIRNLRRCTRGVLPETMPFIAFDSDGVSNYAHHHVPYRPLGEQALQERIAEHLRTHGPRCLVAFSGGRDSSFALQFLRNAGMQPLAYSYDWGMLTDLARRNQARLCGALGVEHIIVSADIKAKRENIRMNVSAWLKRPHLGIVPLFMAGDKQYFYHANALKRAYALQWVVLAANPLERTYFKSGFAGVRPGFGDRPKASDRARLLAFYGGQFLRNPAYLNRSLLDTAGAFLSYYTIVHDHLRIFDYLRWDEQEIDAELQRGFDWEHASDTATTWRIGDGTAAFYNYIFLQVAGFTENDTLRHNQTLEGAITREQALALIERDNQPRFESIEWYCRTIGLDPIDVLRRVCAIPKRHAARQ